MSFRHAYPLPGRVEKSPTVALAKVSPQLEVNDTLSAAALMWRNPLPAHQAPFMIRVYLNWLRRMGAGGMDELRYSNNFIMSSWGSSVRRTFSFLSERPTGDCRHSQTLHSCPDLDSDRVIPPDSLIESVILPPGGACRLTSQRGSDGLANPSKQ